jgi:hypothetical protein
VGSALEAAMTAPGLEGDEATVFARHHHALRRARRIKTGTPS